MLELLAIYMLELAGEIFRVLRFVVAPGWWLGSILLLLHTTSYYLVSPADSFKTL